MSSKILIAGKLKGFVYKAAGLAESFCLADKANLESIAEK